MYLLLNSVKMSARVTYDTLNYFKARSIKRVNFQLKFLAKICRHGLCLRKLENSFFLRQYKYIHNRQILYLTRNWYTYKINSKRDGHSGFHRISLKFRGESDQRLNDPCRPAWGTAICIWQHSMKTTFYLSFYNLLIFFYLSGWHDYIR
jgi:hypothetical protein